MQKRQWARLVRAMAGCGALALLSFGLVGATLAGTGTTQAAGNAFVRVVHAAPAAPDVDVYVDGTKLLSNFTFGTVTDYVPLAAGAHEIAVTPTGKSINEAAIKQKVTVSAGVTYTVAAIGDSATTPALVAFVDHNAVASGKAKVRVYHLSSDAGPVSVATGGKTVISNLEFKAASDYLTVAPGNYTFDVTLKNSNKTVSQPATLEANKVTSIFAIGLAAGSGDTALRFVAATVAATPTGVPPTGFAPTAATTNVELPATVLYTLAVGLLLFGGAGLALARRRPR